MANSLPNVWHLRTVADTAAKNCMICLKPTTAVMITPDNKDFFYICRGHLSDRGFCSPMEDPEEKKREALKLETEKIQVEYKEKLAAKEKKEKEKKKKEGKEGDEKAKDKDKEKNEEKGKGKEKDKDDDDDGKDAAESSKTATEGSATTAGVDIPRIYSLHRNFYQMRIDRLRKAEITKRNRERLSNPNSFPSVPSGFP